jgi:hypothetical protein
VAGSGRKGRGSAVCCRKRAGVSGSHRAGLPTVVVALVYEYRRTTDGERSRSPQPGFACGAAPALGGGAEVAPARRAG